MSNTVNNRKTSWIMYKPCDAKFLIVATEGGKVVEINHFDSLQEAKRAFGEIAHDYGYKSSEINASDKYDVSIWKWTEDRYEKVFGD